MLSTISLCSFIRKHQGLSRNDFDSISISQCWLCYTVTRTIGTGSLPNQKGSSETLLQNVGEICNNIIKGTKNQLVKCKCLLSGEINCSLKSTGCIDELKPTRTEQVQTTADTWQNQVSAKSMAFYY